MSSDLSHSKFWSFDCPYIFRKAAYVTACWFPWIQTMKSRLLDCPRCHLFPFPLSFLSFSLLFCVYFLIFFSFSFWPFCTACNMAFWLPDQRLNLCSLHWKCGVITTGPLGKSLPIPPPHPHMNS